MSRIIRDGAVVTDNWQILQLAEGDEPSSLTLPGDPVIFPLALWLAQREAILARNQDFGLWLAGGEDLEAIAHDFALFKIIAIEFPKFADGRGYSTARLLRSRWGYAGELRAIGEVLHDQLFYMQRVGFNSFALTAGKNIDLALASAFSTFSESYQTAVDKKQPLFRRRSA